MKPRNQELFESTLKFAKAAFQVLASSIPESMVRIIIEDEYGPSFKALINRYPSQVEIIRTLPEFESLVNLMNSEHVLGTLKEQLYSQEPQSATDAPVKLLGEGGIDDFRIYSGYPPAIGFDVMLRYQLFKGKIESLNCKDIMEQSALGFLIALIKRAKGVSWKKEAFATLYQEYESALYSQEISYKTFCILENFELTDQLSDKDSKGFFLLRKTEEEEGGLWEAPTEVDLAGNIKLVRLPKRNLEALRRIPEFEHFLPHELGEIIKIPTSSFLLQTVQKINKHEIIDHRFFSPPIMFYKLITALRLFTSRTVGDVGFNATFLVALTPQIGIMNHIVVPELYPRLNLQYIYCLNGGEEIREFQNFWSQIASVDYGKGELGYIGHAISRFQLARERENLTDRLIDYIFALERLFSRERQNIGKHMAKRAAYTIYFASLYQNCVQSSIKSEKMEEGDKKTKLLNDVPESIREAYRLRNKIVHGSALMDDMKDEEKLSELCSILDEVVRRSIVFLLGIHSIDEFRGMTRDLFLDVIDAYVKLEGVDIDSLSEDEIYRVFANLRDKRKE